MGVSARPRWTDAVAEEMPGSSAGAREDRAARRILRDEPETVAPAIAEALKRPEVAEQVAQNMSNAELAGVVETAAQVGRGRGRAERAEHDDRERGPTFGDVAPGESREELEASVTQWIDARHSSSPCNST